NPTRQDAPTCKAVTQLSIVTSAFGAQVETILGDTDDAQFRVQVGSSVVKSAGTFFLNSTGSRAFGSGEYHRPVLQMSLLYLVNDRGQLLNGAAVGTVFPRPIAVSLALAEDNYAIEPLAACTASGDCYRVKS